MLNLSPLKLIKLWHELELCQQGRNGFGSDTAELYVYTLCDCSPSSTIPGAIGDEIREENGKEAAENLYEVLRIFLSYYPRLLITISNRPYGPWLKRGAILEHRVHVCINKN